MCDFFLLKWVFVDSTMKGSEYICASGCLYAPDMFLDGCAGLEGACAGLDWLLLSYVHGEAL
jgi:hypothetical protein